MLLDFPKVLSSNGVEDLEELLLHSGTLKKVVVDDLRVNELSSPELLKDGSFFLSAKNDVMIGRQDSRRGFRRGCTSTISVPSAERHTVFGQVITTMATA